MDKEIWCYNVLLSTLRGVNNHDLNTANITEKIREELEKRIRTSDEKEYYSHLYALWQSKDFNINYEFDIKNKDGFKAGCLLSLAINQKYSNLAQALIKSGANINKRDEYGCTYLHNCATLGIPDVLKALIERRVNDTPNTEGETALYCAAKLYSSGGLVERKKCAEILIKHTLEKNHDMEMPDFIKNNRKLSEYWNNCKTNNEGWELVDSREDFSTVQITQLQKINRTACSIQ